MNRKVNWIQRIILSVFFIFSLIAIGNTFSYMGREDAKKRLQVDDYLNTDFDYFEIKEADLGFDEFCSGHDGICRFEDTFVFNKEVTIDLSVNHNFIQEDNYDRPFEQKNFSYIYPYQFIEVPEKYMTRIKVEKTEEYYKEIRKGEAFPISIGDNLLEEMTTYGFYANNTYYEPNTITKDNIIGFKFNGIQISPNKNHALPLIVSGIHHIDGSVFHLKTKENKSPLSYSVYFDSDLAEVYLSHYRFSFSVYFKNNEFGFLHEKYTDRNTVERLRNAYDETHMRWKDVSSLDKTNVRFWPWLYNGDLDWISFLWFLIFFVFAMIPYAFITIIDLINLHSAEDFLWFSKKNGFMLIIDYVLFLLCFLFIHFFALSLYPVWIPALIVLTIPSLLMLLLELIASFRLISQWPKKEKKTK